MSTEAPWGRAVPTTSSAGAPVPVPLSLGMVAETVLTMRSVAAPVAT